MANTHEVILPHQIRFLKGLKQGNTPLRFENPGTMFDYDPSIYDASGSTVAYNRLQDSGTLIRPTGSNYIYVKSSDSDDKNGKTIMIRGELNGDLRQEELQLNGATEVQSQYKYDLITTLSKVETDGTITVTDGSDGTVIQTLYSWEKQRKHIRVYLLSTLTEDLDLVALGEIHPSELIYDADVPDVDGLDNILIAYATGDFFQYLNMVGMAREYYAEAAALEQQLWESHHKNEIVNRIVPENGAGLTGTDEW